MANFTANSGSIALTQNVEYSIAAAANYSSGSPQTSLGYVMAKIDLLAMVAGDAVRIRAYSAINGGTQAPYLDATVTGAQSEHYVVPLALQDTGWDVTVMRTTAAALTVKFSVIRDTNDVNALTLGAAAITATSIAAAAITAAKFAANAVDANALATDAVTEIQTGLALAATALSTVQWTNVRAALLDNLDTAVSTRAPSATAVSNVDYTALRAANLDAAISTRAPGSTALSTAQWTNTRAGLVDNLDAAVSTRAAAATALSTTQWTNTRAGLIDNLDAAVSTRAPSATAVSNAVLTPARSANLDNLNATVSSRATPADVTGVGSVLASAIAAVQADTDDIQTRIPTALDGDGNIKAGVQSIVAGAASVVADAVMATVVVTGFTVAGAIRTLLSFAVGKLSGVTGGTYVYRDVLDTKPVITGTVVADGRNAVTVDPT